MILERSDGEDRGKTVVEVKIQWPCNKNVKLMGLIGLRDSLACVLASFIVRRVRVYR